MGLDMFLWRVKAEDAIGDFEIAKGSDGRFNIQAEMAYWRKHYDLHQWMENLYRAKGGTAESFNLIQLRLTMADLNILELDIKADTMPSSSPFPYDEETKQADLAVIASARETINDGYAVYYDSWW